MSKLCIFSLGFQGHVNPILGVARELVGRGDRVTYYTTEDCAREVLNTGAVLRPYDSTFNRSFVFPRVKTGQASPYLVRSLQEARQVLPQVIEHVRRDAPDAILYDGACLTGHFLSEALGIPAVKLCPSYASTERYTPFAEGRASFIENPASMEAYDVEAARLKTEFGVTALDLRREASQVEPLNIVFMPKVFHPCPEKFDGRFVFVGPSLRRESGSGFYVPGETDKPLLYISLGTLNNEFPEFFKLCAKAFGSCDWRVIMAIGNRIDRTVLGDLPPNIVAVPHVPQLEVLANADLFITQGGMNSAQEALHFGVPLFVIPSTPEQAVTARRVTELGLGGQLDQEGLTAETLFECLGKVDGDEAIQKKVARMAEISRGAGGAHRAVEAVHQFLSRDPLSDSSFSFAEEADA
jgi:MGT family glycosyltransferase